MNYSKEKKLKILKDWLLRNGYKKEAFLVKESLMGPTPQRIEEIKKKSLSPDSPSLIDSIQLGLDLAGFIPGIGEIADFINTIIYIIRKKWFEAALSVLAMLPFLGIASTLLKRLTPKEEAVEIIVKSIAESGVSVDSVRRQAYSALDNLDAALKKLQESMPEEYARNIQEGSLELVKKEIDAILGRARSYNFPTQEKLDMYERVLPGPEATDAHLYNMDWTPRQSGGRRDVERRLKRISEIPAPMQEFWKQVDGPTLNKLMQASRLATEKALVRTADNLGENLMPKLKSQLPELSQEELELVQEQVKKNIIGIEIVYLETLEDLVGNIHPWFSMEHAQNTLGHYSPSTNKIFINIPGISFNAAEHNQSIPVRLADTILHEINHNLDGIIGKAYNNLKGGKDSSIMLTSIKGVPIADWIAKAKETGILKGSKYLEIPAEIQTRMRNLKLFFKNNGAEQILKLVANNGDKLDDNAVRLLRGASSAQDGHSMIGAILYIKNVFPEIWSKIIKHIEHSGDIYSLASIIDYEKFASDPGLLVNLIEAL